MTFFVGLHQPSGARHVCCYDTAGRALNGGVTDMAAEDYWVYHNRQAPERGVIIHRGNCRDCQHGQGKRGGTDPRHGQWHGPFSTLQDAWHHAYGLSQVGQPRECAHGI